MCHLNCLFEMLWSGSCLLLDGLTMKTWSLNRGTSILRSLYPAAEEAVYLTWFRALGVASCSIKVVVYQLRLLNDGGFTHKPLCGQLLCF